MGLLSVDEQLLHVGTARISAPPQPPSSASGEVIEDYERRFGAWERLRELVAKAAVEAHAKEIVYGGPLLVGQLPKKTGRLEAVLAPLFMQAVRAEVLSNGDVELSAVNKSPRFNTVVWREAVDTKTVEQIVALGVEAQGELAAGWDPARVQTLLEGIASVMPGLVPAEPGNAVNAGRCGRMPDHFPRFRGSTCTTVLSFSSPTAHRRTS